MTRDFYPRSPCGERPQRPYVRDSKTGNFYPRSPCGERRQAGGKQHSRRGEISIHALLAESDQLPPPRRGHGGISIHALLAESDLLWQFHGLPVPAFLSTLSLRRATSSRIISSSVTTYFYPRSPCGERLVAPPYNLMINQFLSTLSLRRATSCKIISSTIKVYFYPRSPCGERPLSLPFGAVWIDFYPRSPCGERQTVNQLRTKTENISIHALLAESDQKPQEAGEPHGDISIHALLAESDPAPVACRPHAHISIHALLAESDGLWSTHPTDTANFYPRSPCGERPTRTPDLTTIGQFLSTLSLRRATCLLVY